MSLRVVLKLALLLVGALVGAGLVYKVAAYRPFLAAPPLPLAQRAAPPRVAAGLQPEENDLAAVLFESTRAQTPPLSETLNILLAGLDTRPDFQGGRTDALVLVVIDEKSGHVGFVGIPRDLAFPIPGFGVERINTLYLHGVREGGPARGVELLEQAVRHVLGLRVDHVVFVDHSGFEELLDALGGVSVQVICPIRDRFLDPRGPDGRLELKLEAGVHWLDGKTALMYARSRHGRGIIDRARRQQAVLLGIRDRLSTLGVARALELAPLLQKTVYTDLTAADLVRLGRLLQKVAREQIHGLVLDGKHADPTVLEDGRWVMIPKPDAILDALSRLFEAGPPGWRKPSTCPPMDAALEQRAGATGDSALEQRARATRIRGPRGPDSGPEAP